MSPQVTTFAGISVYPLGFTRGVIPTVYFAAHFDHSSATGYDGYAKLDSANNLYAIIADSSRSNYVYIDAAANIGTIYGWASNYGQSARNIELDTAGNPHFVAPIPTGYQNAEVVKATNSGTKTWSRTFTNSGNLSESGRIALDTSNNVFLVTEMFYSGTGQKWQVVKYNSSGTIQWQKNIYFGSSSTGWDIAVSQVDGTIVTAGSNSTSGDANVIKLNTDGTTSWHRWNSSGRFPTVAVDSTNAVYVSRHVSSTTFIDKFDSSGTWQWGRQYTVSGASANQKISVDPSNNVYIMNYGSNFVNVAKYNSSGTLQWQRRMTSSSGNFTQATGRANITVSNTAIAFTVQELNNYGSPSTTMVFRLPADGTLTGTYTCGTYSYTWAAASGTDASNTNAYSSNSMTNAAGSGTDAAGSLAISTTTGYTTTKKVIP